jgi:mRNA interferase HigB
MAIHLGRQSPDALCDLPGLRRRRSRTGNVPLVPVLGTEYHLLVQIVARRTLKRFWERHRQAEVLLRNWYTTVAAAEWKGPADVKMRFGASVDFVADNGVVFDVAGNKYRLVVHVSYRYKRVLIKFVGTHKEYDRIDPNTV